tara:strand:+ start:34 stop:261 length:228 start_codon:yes stop_codon:yes gene_type:complete
MGLSTILFLISIIILAIYSYVFLALNQNIVLVDLLFLDIDIGLGQVILLSTLTGILIAIFLEVLFFSVKRRKKDE